MLSCMPHSQHQSLDLALDILVVGLEVQTNSEFVCRMYGSRKYPNKPKTGTSSENHLQLDSTYTVHESVSVYFHNPSRTNH